MSAQNREKLARQVLGRHPLKQSLIGVSVIALLVLVWVGLQEANYGGPVIAFILTPVICALLLLSVVAPLEAFFHKKNYNRFFNMIANGEIVPSFFTKRGTVIVDLEHYMIHLDSKESLDLRTLRSLGSRTRRWEKSLKFTFSEGDKPIKEVCVENCDQEYARLHNFLRQHCGWS